MMSIDQITLGIPKHFDFKEMLFFLDRGYDECLHQVNNKDVSKLLNLDGSKGLVNVYQQDSRLKLKFTGAGFDPVILTHYVNSWFDLDRDLGPFFNLLENTPVTRTLLSYTGLRIIGIPDLFEALSWCIIGQQINLTFAHKIKRALVEQFGDSVSEEGNTFYLFPTAAVLSRLSIEDLMSIQFSRRKAEYLSDLAEKFESGFISKQKLQTLGSTELMIEKLCEIRGIGPWTANYAAMKTMGRPDCIPWGDTGILDAIKKLLQLHSKPDKEQVANFYAPFAGWESYLTQYLWRSLY